MNILTQHQSSDWLCLSWDSPACLNSGHAGEAVAHTAQGSSLSRYSVQFSVLVGVSGEAVDNMGMKGMAISRTLLVIDTERVMAGDISLFISIPASSLRTR
ncbi:hypothetical protein HRE53_15270 [Acaryochloris sp. 'Moss Beach']|uniref:hypothetical protein n=1 Tax=Acaryochloris sp. 'Moss Beach' TaxID=2740837 RepID=UPI001F1E47A7|nr:hypothetical protein [Acaryochloris sp. 'Moss Beach']UJB67987.1 hypothetical protein HRE53_15270 [Acaryochloris sp. 'Moss Beach']